jgi:uncharacterized membrane protein
LIEEKVLAARQRGLGVIFFFYESLWQASFGTSRNQKSGNSSNVFATHHSPSSRAGKYSLS